MKPGQASRTAVLVCTGRAIGHARGQIAQFSDPTALALLPDDVRSDIERYIRGDRPKGPRGWFVRPWAPALTTPRVLSSTPHPKVEGPPRTPRKRVHKYVRRMRGEDSMGGLERPETS